MAYGHMSKRSLRYGRPAHGKNAASAMVTADDPLPWRVIRHVTRDRLAIALALAAPLAAAAILLPWRPSWANTNVALLLVAVVVAVAALGNRIAGALAAIGAAVWFDFFFTSPYQRFTIRDSADITLFAVLLTVGMAVSQLAARARRLKVIAITDAGYLAHIHDTAMLAQSASSPDAVVDHVKKQLTGLLELENCRFEYGELIGHPWRLEQDGTMRPGYGRWLFKPSCLLPGDEVELPAVGHGQYYGRFMCRPKPEAELPLQARLTAVTLADLVGQTLGAIPPADPPQAAS